MTTLVDRAVEAPVETTTPRSAPWWLAVGAAVVVAAGVALRFLVRSHLWLDESLSVQIARHPITQIPAALRHDGAPPLYYFLLHGWMRIFGTSDVAVRALSGIASVASLPLVYRVGRRIGGRRAGWAALVIMATSPFATHYATETRMYSLVALMALVGFLALVNALEHPTVPRLAGVAASTALLLYTHYWAIYLIAAAGVWLLWTAWRGGDGVIGRPAAIRSIAAMVAGGVAFLPWLPIFLYQAAHTGTPWARPAGFGALVSVVEEFAGGGDERARILALVLFGLAALGLLGRAIDARYVVLDLRTQPRARGLAAVVVGTPTLAIAAGMLSHTAFVARYTSVVFPAFCVLAGMGVTALASRRARTVVLAVAAALGLAIGIGGIFVARTQAGEFAAALKAHARPGDVVAFCPDQLGPAVTRLLPKGLQGVTQLTYPRGTSPAGIDWVDYGDAVRAAPVDQFAESLDARAGPAHSVWVVWGRGYRPYHTRCTALVDDLARRRGSEQLVVRSRPIHYFEHGTLLRFGG